MNTNDNLLVLTLQRGWVLLCICATLITVIMQCHNYGKGEDDTQVEYKSFNERELDVYPSIATCLTIAINEERLKVYGANYTAKDYDAFLKGLHWDENMLKVDYENVIQHWDEYIIRYGYEVIDPESLFQRVPIYVSKEIDPTSPAIMHGFRELSVLGMKCFSINVLFQKDVTLRYFTVYLKTSIFPNGMRPEYIADPKHGPAYGNALLVKLHYPKQCFRDITQGVHNWPARRSDESYNYRMQFSVRGIEVLERRNKINRPCDIDFPDLDYQMIETVLQKVGCKPPYWNSSSLLPLCSTHKEMMEAAKLNFGLVSKDAKRAAILKSLPCRGLERIHYDFVDEPFTEAIDDPILNGSMGISFKFEETNYKEFKHVRSMDEQALIGK